MSKTSEINIRFDFPSPEIALGDTLDAHLKRLCGLSIPKSLDLISRADFTNSCANTLALIQSIEQVSKIEINEETKLLRELIIKLEIVYTHTNHLHKKIIPKLLLNNNFNDNILKNKKEFFISYTILKKIEEALIILTKRFPHPINITVGGFYVIISDQEKIKLINLLKEIIPLFTNLLDILVKQRKSKDLSFSFTSFWDIQSTQLINGVIKSSDSEPLPFIDYYSNYKINELQSLVGPLSRINNSNKLINYTAEKYIKKLGLKFPLQNMYQIPLIMNLESIYLIENAIETLKILNLEKVSHKKDYKLIPGVAYFCIESAKGLMYYEFEFGEDIIKNIFFLSPLNQNLKIIDNIISNLDLDFDRKTRKDIIDEVKTIIDYMYL